MYSQVAQKSMIAMRSSRAMISWNSAKDSIDLTICEGDGRRAEQVSTRLYSVERTAP